MSTTDLDIVSVGISSGSGLIRDLKGAITTWTRDGTATGHFDAANAEVVVGCVVTFADASTATIIAKSGDGTGSNGITLSADHATDAALASITGLAYATPNVQPNSVYANETVSGSSSAGTVNEISGYTRIDTQCSVPAGRRITKVGLYSTATSGTITFKLIQDNGSGSYTVTDLQSFTKTETGYQQFTLSTPYTLPSSGTFYLGFHSATAQGNAGSSTGTLYYKSGDITGTSSGWSSDSSHLQITARYDQQFTAAGLYVTVTSAAQADTNPWFSLDGVTVTQTLGSGAVAYHAVSVNKGDAAERWWVYLSSTWRSIVALTSGTWQYRDASGTLQNASINSRLGALAQAFAITENQMGKPALEAVTAGQWADVFVCGTIDFACGLQASGHNLAQLDKWTATYTPKPIYAIGGAGWVAGFSAFGE